MTANTKGATAQVDEHEARERVMAQSIVGATDEDFPMGWWVEFGNLTRGYVTGRIGKSFGVRVMTGWEHDLLSNHVMTFTVKQLGDATYVRTLAELDDRADVLRETEVRQVETFGQMTGMFRKLLEETDTDSAVKLFEGMMLQCVFAGALKERSRAMEAATG